MSLLPSKPDTPDENGDAEPRVIGVDSDDADEVISALSSQTARKLLAELHEEPAAPSDLADRADTSLQNAQYHLQKLKDAGAVSVIDTAYSSKGREMDVYAPADEPLVIFAGGGETTGLRAALAQFIGGVGILGIGSLIVQKLYGRGAETSQAPSQPPPSGDGDTIISPEGSQDAGAPPDSGVNQTEGADGAREAISGTIDNVTVNFESVQDGVSRSIENATVHFPNTSEANITVGNNTSAAVGESVNQTTNAPEVGTALGVEPGILFFAGGAVILSLWLALWYLHTR